MFLFFKYRLLSSHLLRIYLYSIFILLISLSLNQMGVVEAIKIAGAQSFFFVGTITSIKYKKFVVQKYEQYSLISILFFLPLLILILQIISILPVEEGRELSSIFVNKNNAALYFLSLGPLLYYLGFKKKFLIIYLLMLSIFLKTMGVLVAVFLSVIIIYKKITPKIFFYIVFFILLLVVFSYLLKDIQFSALDRITSVFNTIKILFSNYTLTELADLEFGKAVELTGTSDLSFLFRIKHWTDIVLYYINAPWYNQLFGIGLGNIQNVTQIGLVAHNDFLKFIVEIGLFYFFTFIIFMFNILKIIIKYDKFISIFFLTIFIYFGTENLTNNFLAMSFFYYFLGIYYQKAKESKL